MLHIPYKENSPSPRQCTIFTCSNYNAVYPVLRELLVIIPIRLGNVWCYITVWSALSQAWGAHLDVAMHLCSLVPFPNEVVESLLGLHNCNLGLKFEGFLSRITRVFTKKHSSIFRRGSLLFIYSLLTVHIERLANQLDLSIRRSNYHLSGAIHWKGDRSSIGK